MDGDDDIILRTYLCKGFVVTVILEHIDESGRRSSEHVDIDTVTVEHTPLKSLIILVHQGPQIPHLDVYADCTFEGSIPFKRAFRQIPEMENLHVQVVSLFRSAERSSLAR